MGLQGEAGPPGLSYEYRVVSASQEAGLSSNPDTEEGLTSLSLAFLICKRGQ